MRLRFVLLALLSLPFVPVVHAADLPGALSGPPSSLEPTLQALTSDGLFKTSTVGLQVVDVASGEEVFAWGADTAMSPASTMKVVTAAVALRQLGPAYRFVTELSHDGEVRGDGTLDGSLYVRGTGDPRMVIERLWKLVYDLKLAGVSKVSGDVIFDDSFMEDSPLLPGWDKPRDLARGPAYFATLGALSLNFNTASVVVAPGARPGEAARVMLETPASGYVEVKSEVITGGDRSRSRIRMDREVMEDGTRFVLSGAISGKSAPIKYYRTIAHPTSHFMGAFAELLQTHGIEVEGEMRRGQAPEEPTILVQAHSPPLTTILMDVNKYSNNFMAEQVLRAVAAEVRGEGSHREGLALIEEYLDGLGLEGTYTLVNGSGLSRDIRLTPATLNAVLVDMAHDPAVGSEFAATLAIAGLDGTLSRRLEDEPSKLRGKTGTIDGVHCLAGYLDAPDGRRYAFAFMVNDLRGSVAQARDLHDHFARQLLGMTGQDAVVQQGPIE